MELLFLSLFVYTGVDVTIIILITYPGYEKKS